MIKIHFNRKFIIKNIENAYLLNKKKPSNHLFNIEKIAQQRNFAIKNFNNIPRNDILNNNNKMSRKRI